MPDSTPQEFQLTRPFETRALSFEEIVAFDGWQLKLYSVRFDDSPLRRDVVDEAISRSRWVLPRPAQTVGRPGLGFLIAHQGRGVDYFLINWWDRENEMYNRVLTRRQGAGADWQAGTAGEMACVWDLEIVWHERNAYVRHVMSEGSSPDFGAYLADVA